jgi:hypothetical protein
MSIASEKDNLKENLTQFKIISHHLEVFFHKGLKIATIIKFLIIEFLNEITTKLSHTLN